jgi:hypothetical protein
VVRLQLSPARIQSLDFDNFILRTTSGSSFLEAFCPKYRIHIGYRQSRPRTCCQQSNRNHTCIPCSPVRWRSRELTLHCKFKLDMSGKHSLPVKYSLPDRTSKCMKLGMWYTRRRLLNLSRSLRGTGDMAMAQATLNICQKARQIEFRQLCW